MIYKISSVYLYDNQVDHQYIILSNKTTAYTGGEKWDLPYGFSNAFNAIFAQKNVNRYGFDKNAESIALMRIQCKHYDIPLIKNDGFLTVEKTCGTHLPNYNAYDIYWNESLSGINIHDYEVCHIWGVGESQYSTYRIWEHVTERDKVLRDNKIINLLDE